MRRFDSRKSARSFSQSSRSVAIDSSVLSRPVLLRGLDGVLDRVDLLERRAEERVDADEALRRLGQLLLDLVRADEERLEVGPLALHLRHLREHVRDVAEVLLPAGALRLEGGEVLGRHHALHDELVVLERLEVLLLHAHQEDVRVAVLVELELDRRPRHVELLERLLHLVLLDRAVDHLAHVVDELVQLEREQVGERELGPHVEGLARDLHEQLPVARRIEGERRSETHGSATRKFLRKASMPR